MAIVAAVEPRNELEAALAVNANWTTVANSNTTPIVADVLAVEAGLADAVDAFMEGIAFSGQQTARVFAAARALGLPVKLHADQLSNLGGAALASEFAALSADHLEHVSSNGIAALATAKTANNGTLRENNNDFRRMFGSVAAS